MTRGTLSRDTQINLSCRRPRDLRSWTSGSVLSLAFFIVVISSLGVLLSEVRGIMVWHPKERPGPRLILVVGVAVAALVNIERFDLQVRYGVPVPVFDASDASAWLGFARPTTGALTSMPTRERSPETGMYFFDGAPPNATTETDEGWTMGFQFPGPSLGKSFSQCLTYHVRDPRRTERRR